MRRLFKISGIALALILIVGLSAVAWFMLSTPGTQRLALIPDLIDIHSAQGQQLLHEAAAQVDLAQLQPEFETQNRRAFCGVASSVMVINAILQPQPRLTQETLFTPRARAIRDSWAVSFGGLTLDQLARIIEAHGVHTQTVHAVEASEASFRDTLRAALAEPRTFVVANYDRRVLAQEGTGHISPVAAYSAQHDAALVLDVAAYKYPYTWIPLPKLWQAMRSADSDSGKTRGYLLVTR